MATRKDSKLAVVIAALSSGLGASRLSPSVTALRVKTYRKPMQAGERAFIKAVLPRLAYANPSIPIDVTFITSRARSESTPQPTESGSEISAQASSQATENEISREIASVTLEFDNGLPPRKVQLTSWQVRKPASLITREILDLARFTDQALKERQSQSKGSAASPSILAPKPSSTNFTGSAEGLSAGVQ